MKMILDKFKFQKWDHYSRIMAPLTFGGHEVFMTVGPPIPPPMRQLIYSVARQCPQHHFAVNVNNVKNIGNWCDVPSNVLPVFRVNNANPDEYYEWLDRDYHDPFRPKVISLWCETKEIPDRLEEVDWILLYGLKYKSVEACFSKILNVTPNIYVAQYRYSSDPNSLPYRFRYRAVPQTIRNFFEDRLW